MWCWSYLVGCFYIGNSIATHADLTAELTAAQKFNIKFFQPTIGSTTRRASSKSQLAIITPLLYNASYFHTNKTKYITTHTRSRSSRQHHELQVLNMPVTSLLAVGNPLVQGLDDHGRVPRLLSVFVYRCRSSRFPGCIRPWRVASPHPTPRNKRTDSSRAQPLFNAVRMRRSKGSYIRTRYVKSPHPERVPHLWWKSKLFHGFATFGTYALVTVYISPELYNPWTWNLYCWTQLAKMDVLKCCSNLMRWGCHHAWTWAYEYLPFLFHGPSYVWVGVVLCLL